MRLIFFEANDFAHRGIEIHENNLLIVFSKRDACAKRHTMHMYILFLCTIMIFSRIRISHSDIVLCLCGDLEVYLLFYVD